MISVSTTRKPKFVAQGSRGKRKEVKQRWRRPKGLHSKLRLGKKGHPVKVTTGYRTPLSTRGQNKVGLLAVVVQTVTEIAHIPEKHGIIISGSVGMKKKIEIISVAVEKNITILNIKDIDAYKKKVNDLIASRREKVADRNAKQKAIEEKTKKEEKKEEKSEEISDEEKKQEEKKELDKVLTQK